MIALSKHVRLSTAALSCTGDRLLSVRTAHFLKCGGALYIMLSALHLRCTAVLSDRCCLDMFFSCFQEEMGKDAGAGAD